MVAIDEINKSTQNEYVMLQINEKNSNWYNKIKKNEYNIERLVKYL